MIIIKSNLWDKDKDKLKSFEAAVKTSVAPVWVTPLVQKLVETTHFQLVVLHIKGIQFLTHQVTLIVKQPQEM